MIVAKRYARALFELAKAEGRVLETGGELRLFMELLDNTPELKILLCGPVYDLQAKREALERVRPGLNLSDLVFNFLNLLIKKGRVSILDEIVEAYQRLEDEETGRIRAKVYLPDGKLGSPLLDKIRARLEGLTGKEILLDLKEDKDMIGGVTVQIGDTLIDGSVRSKLLSVKKRIRGGV